MNSHLWFSNAITNIHYKIQTQVEAYLFAVRTPTNCIYAALVTMLRGQLAKFVPCLSIIYNALPIRANSNKFAPIWRKSHTVDKIRMVPADTECLL